MHRRGAILSPHQAGVIRQRILLHQQHLDRWGLPSTATATAADPTAANAAASTAAAIGIKVSAGDSAFALSLSRMHARAHAHLHSHTHIHSHASPSVLLATAARDYSPAFFLQTGFILFYFSDVPECAHSRVRPALPNTHSPAAARSAPWSIWTSQ